MGHKKGLNTTGFAEISSVSYIWIEKAPYVFMMHHGARKDLWLLFISENFLLAEKNLVAQCI